MNIELLGIKISVDRKQEILSELAERARSGKQSFIVTPYSEFFYRSFYDYEFKQILNEADFALPDGVAVQWLARYLSIPFHFKNFYPKIAEAFWQMVYSGAQILLWPSAVRKIVKEKISGADFFWDLCKLADKNDFSVFLLGGFGDTAKICAEKIKERYPAVKIAGFSNSDPGDHSLPEQIQNSKADILMVAFGPVRQEKWIAHNRHHTGVKIIIGLGGTFDYIAGARQAPPHWIRRSGLEWLFRLITQPKRFKRIWNGTFGLIKGTIRHKVFMSMPFRQNAVGVIINGRNQVFVARRKPKKGSTEQPDGQEHWQFPQGGIDPKEHSEKAVLREMREEIATTKLEVLGRSEKRNFYLWNHAIRPLIFNRLKFKGQEQQIFYLRYSGDDTDIELDQHELTEYKWIDPSELQTVIHPFRKPLTDIVTAEIGTYLHGR